MGTDNGNRAIGDRRQATVLFADISGFTAMSREMDPEDVKETMDECFLVIERLITERGGTIDKYIGDCVMALFGAPVAIEQAAQQAINTAIAIRSAIAAIDENHTLPVRLSVHVGINTGLVAAGTVGGKDRRDYTVMGEAVNFAARLQDAAKNGQIVVGDATYKAASREFKFRERSLNLKGYDGSVPGFEVLTEEERKYRVRPDDTAVGARSAMIGRGLELDTIAERAENLHEGAACIVTVVGENGLGKSRLYSEVRSLPVMIGLEVVEARFLAIGTGLAFHGFIDFLRNWSGVAESDDSTTAFKALEDRIRQLRLDDPEQAIAVGARLYGLQGEEFLSNLLKGLEGEALERVIHQAFSDLLHAIAEEAPLVVVVEDLHWADRSSMRLLEALLPLVRSASVMFFVLCRPQYPETTEYLLGRVDEGFSDVHTAIRLRPLTPAAIAELTRNLAGTKELPGSVHRLIEDRTEGNPFYVEEVVRNLAEQGALGDEHSKGRHPAALELPATIEGVILTRVDRLEPAIKDVLQFAAVVGRRFDRDVVAALAGGDVDVDRPLAELVEKELLAPFRSRHTASAKVQRLTTSKGFIFKHALIQEAVYGSILKKKRRELHSACAQLLEEKFAGRFDDAYGMLAYHYLRAEMLEKAEEYTFKAGELAARTAASHEALDHFREAYRLYHLTRKDGADDAKLRALEINIAQALFNTGNLAESIEHFDAALELFGRWVPKSKLSLWTKFGTDISGLLFRLYTGRNRTGKKDSEEAQVIVQVMYNRARAENIADPERYIFDTIATPRYLQKLDPFKCEQACEVTATTGAFFAFGGVSITIARKFLDEAAHMIGEDRPADEFSHRAMGTLVEFHAGDWSSRYDISEDVMQSGLRAGRLWTADIYLGMMAARCLRQGRFDEVESHMGRVRQLQSEYGYQFAASTEHAETAFCLVEQRRLAEAAKAMQLYYEIRQEAALHVLALSGSAKISALGGDIGEASEFLERAEAIVDRGNLLAPYYLGACRTTRLLLDVLRLEERPGDRAAAKAARRSAKKALSVSRSIARERVEASRLSARVSIATDRKAEAFRYFGNAIDEAERLDARPELARVYLDIAHALEGSETSESYRDKQADAYRSDALVIFDAVGNEAEAAGLRPSSGGGFQGVGSGQRYEVKASA